MKQALEVPRFIASYLRAKIDANIREETKWRTTGNVLRPLYNSLIPKDLYGCEVSYESRKLVYLFFATNFN